MGSRFAYQPSDLPISQVSISKHYLCNLATDRQLSVVDKRRVRGHSQIESTLRGQGVGQKAVNRLRECKGGDGQNPGHFADRHPL